MTIGIEKGMMMEKGRAHSSAKIGTGLLKVAKTRRS